MTKIVAEKVYGSLTFEALYWPKLTLRETLSGDWCAGFVMASLAVYRAMQRSSNFHDEYAITILPGPIQVNTPNESQYIHILENYILFRSQSRADLASIKLTEARYYWRIRNFSTPDESYDIITFTSPQFISGFLSFCKYINAEFRNYIAGLPFTNDGFTYNIEGYDVEPFSPIIHLPSFPVPYYITTTPGDGLPGDAFGIDWI